jgi:hypothetical protein
MARQRNRRDMRGVSADQTRYPNFEGISANLTASPQPSVEPGARRGNVGQGAFEQPGVAGPQSRLDGLRISGKGRGKGKAGPQIDVPRPVGPPQASSGNAFGRAQRAAPVVPTARAAVAVPRRGLGGQAGKRGGGKGGRSVRG